MSVSSRTVRTDPPPEPAPRSSAFDTGASDATASRRRERPSLYFRTTNPIRRKQRFIAFATVLLPLIGSLIAIPFAVEYGVGLLELALFAGMYVATTLGIEFGYHRLLSHRAFATPLPIRIVATVCGAMAGQGRVLHWVADHRRHHAHSDTEDDPHSPHVKNGEAGRVRMGRLRGWWHAHIGHMLNDEVTNCTLFAADLSRDPVVSRLNRLYVPCVVLGLALPAAIGGLVAGTWIGALQGFFWGGVIRMFVVQQVTWSVASFAHMFGRRPYDARDRSTNNFSVALLSFGSAWQNNHHAFPKSAYLGLEWWEVDITAWFIDVLARLGLVTKIHRPNESQLREKRRDVE